MELCLFLRLGCRCRRNAHLAVALENGAFLDNELLGLDVPYELGRTFENHLFGAVDIALDGACNHSRLGLDVAFDVAALFDNEFAIDADASVYHTSNADIALADNVALDGNGVADLGNFLFFTWHVVSPMN